MLLGKVGRRFGSCCCCSCCCAGVLRAAAIAGVSLAVGSPASAACVRPASSEGLYVRGVPVEVRDNVQEFEVIKAHTV